MAGLSRFAVMQHLEVLAGSGLVLYRRAGRRRLNFANPIPLQEMYERWVSSPASSAAETDLHLKRYAETEAKKQMENEQFRLVKIESELHVKAPREQVFSAFFENYDAWWPHRYYPESKCSAEEKPGGFIYEHFPQGGGAITGTVVYVDRPSKFVATGPSSLSRGSSGYNVVSFEEDGHGGTVLKRSLEIWGSVPDELEKMFREGTKQFLDGALLGFLEQGKRYSAEARS